MLVEVRVVGVQHEVATIWKMHLTLMLFEFQPRALYHAPIIISPRLSS
jgi:hypothetical protein